MVWTYLAASEESPSPWLPGSDQLPTVKSTDTLKPFYFLKWQAVAYQSPQFGMTCEPSKLTIGQVSTLSLAASRARISALQALAGAWRASEAAFSGKSLGSLASYDQPSSSWKTCQQSLLAEGGTWSEPLPRWGMTVDGVLSALPALGPTTSGNAGFYWPTPKATRRGDCPSERERRTPDLHSAVNLYPTPTASNTKAVHLRSGGRTARSYWPTPTTQDAKQVDPPHHREKRKSPCLGTLANQSLETTGGQLNPTWVEWLMGYPAGWTELSAWVIPWFRSNRALRSRSSAGSGGDHAGA